jgi:CubicO group peptidase (beta-lactamase class C family)
MLLPMRRIRLLVAVAFAAVIALTASPAAAKGPLSAKQADAVRAYVRDVLHQLNVPGAAVVIVGAEGIEFAEGFGTARDNGTPVNPQTPFQIASLSKELTAIAVRQLIDSGDLSLDATVHSYLDWFGSNGSDTARITIRNLLGHTSGWSESQGLTNRIDESNHPNTLELNVRRLASEPLDHPIGHFEYSNANYDVLGYLVAVVSGTSYEAYMTEHVLSPLQMTHTHLSDAEARADGLAQGHYPFFGVPIAYDIPFVPGSVPSSFIAASAEDLGHVLIAHLNGGSYEGTHVLEASSMARLRQPLTHPDPSSGYGWGWWSYPLWGAGELKDGADISRYDVPVMLEHGGSHATFASGMVLLPAEGIGVVVLMNLNDELAPSRFYQLHTGIAQIMLGHDAPALTSYDDFLSQYGKVVGVVWVLALVLLVSWSVRRYRRWRRDPASMPHGLWAVTRRMVLPLLVVAAQLAAAIWLLSSRGASLLDFPRLARLNPDVGLLVAVLVLLSSAWALIGTIWTLRLLRRGLPA